MYYFYCSIFIFQIIQITKSQISFKDTKIALFSENFPQNYKFEVKTNSEERLCIELCINDKNENKKCYKLVIDNGSFHIWLNKNKIDKTLISSISKTSQIITYKNGDLIGKNSKQIFYTNEEYSIGNLNILISDSIPKIFEDYDGMIGLGYLTNSNEEYIFSFIQQLYENNLIYHRVFTQSFLSNKKGEISFGEIPKNIIEDYINYGRCNAIEELIVNGKKIKNPKWQCHIIGIFYGKKFNPKYIEREINGTVSFFTYSKRALIPKKVFEYFEKTYFLELIKYNYCRIEKQKEKYDIFICKKDMIFDIDFNFVFGDWIMHFPAEKMFIEYNDNEIQFIFCHKKNHEEWTLGRPIINQFIMIYDFENKQIGFYNKNNVLKANDLPAEPPKVFGRNYRDNVNQELKIKEKEFFIRKIFFFGIVFIINVVIFVLFCRRKKKRRSNVFPLIKKNFSELNEMDL